MRKKKWFRFFWIIEVLFLSYYYLYGAHGLFHIALINKKAERIAQKASQIDKEIEQLRSYIAEWKSEPFFKEKIAREQLHMARPEEHIYYVT